MVNLKVTNAVPNMKATNFITKMTLGVGDVANILGGKSLEGQPIGLLLVLTYALGATVIGELPRGPHLSIKNA